MDDTKVLTEVAKLMGWEYELHVDIERIDATTFGSASPLYFVERKAYDLQLRSSGGRSMSVTGEHLGEVLAEGLEVMLG